jgi:hypothetical protein
LNAGDDEFGDGFCIVCGMHYKTRASGKWFGQIAEKDGLPVKNRRSRPQSHELAPGFGTTLPEFGTRRLAGRI